jgi:hypothetical protein
VRATDTENAAFVSQWDNYPNNITVQLLDSQVEVNDVVWLLVSACKVSNSVHSACIMYESSLPSWLG